MTRLTAIAIFTVLLSAIGPQAFAAPRPDGVWRIISDEDGKPRALMRLQTIDGSVHGVITASLIPGDDPNRLCDRCPGDRRGKRIVGMEILWGLKPDPNDPLTYRGGSILDPNTGNIYQARLAVNPDGNSLTVRGFLGLALFGRTQIWRRVE
jgi:uncharacterized protein (DUF2147 family)